MARFGRQVLASVVCASLVAPGAYAAPPGLRFNGSVGMGYDSNISNAELPENVRTASNASAGVNLEYEQRFSPYTALLARASVDGEAYSQASKLSNGKATTLLRLSHRPYGGFFMPGFALWASAAYWQFGSRIRDSNEYRGGVMLTEQLTSEISARLSLAASQRNSASRVFDLSGESAALNLDWLASSALTIYGAYQFHYGNLVSTTSPSPKVARAAEVIEPDDAFGGAAASEFAYRLKAHTQIGTLGFNYALSHDYSIDAQVQGIDSQSARGNSYTRVVSVLSLLARF